MTVIVDKLEYSGIYVIHLRNDPRKKYLPRTVEIKGDKVYVTIGTIEEVKGGFKFKSYNRNFYLNHFYVKKITGNRGKVIWESKEEMCPWKKELEDLDWIQMLIDRLKFHDRLSIEMVMKNTNRGRKTVEKNFKRLVNMRKAIWAPGGEEILPV